VTVRWLALVHHLPERTRLRSPVLRRDPAACERVADALAALPGVREVRVRPYTGSVLIDHERDVSTEALIEATRRVLDCALVLQPNEPPPLDGDAPPLSSVARKLAATVREIDRDILRGTDGTVDLGTLATLGLFGAGAFEVVTTGKLQMPPWFNLAWWGFRTFVTAEHDEIDAEADNGDEPAQRPPLRS
jgi:hypothetical protein